MRDSRMLLVVLAVGLSAPAWAQPPDEDGPGRGVARISLLNGEVSVRRGDSGDLIAAGVNAPLVVQDRILTGVGSRTELQFDWANFLRVAANAEVRLAELEQKRYIVQVAHGTVTWRVLRDQDAYIEISTPSISVRPLRRGTYRITVQEDGSSEITVRSGEVDIFTPRGSERVRSGRTMVARGAANDPEFRIVPEIGDDDWDRWNAMRDRDLERSRSYQYLSRDIYGAEDLDAHGQWIQSPAYGWVWSPRVAVGWAPYRQGRWVWIDWYGWSWVSYDPWGWAPYHYGRWFYNGPSGWCWWPGQVGVRHYWSPGIVAFFGFGGIGGGWGRVGWVPLGPREPFHRWWGRGVYGGYRNPGYFDNRVTVVNNVNITNVYRNARVDHGVTVVDQDGFRRGRLGESVRYSSDEFRQVSMARGAVPVSPERESLRFADREPSARTIAATRGPERFFSNARPAQVDRVPFEEQRRGMEQISRRSFAAETPRTADSGVSRGTTGWRSTEASATPQARTEEQRGWRRIGDTPRTPTADGTNRAPDGGAVRGADTGWRRFGSARVSESTGADRGGRSFGEPSAPRSDPSPRSESGRPATSDAPADNWRRFGGGSGSRAESAPADAGWRRGVADGSATRSLDRTDSGRSASPRMEAPSRMSESPRMERRSDIGAGASRGESIRISPPIVRERGGDYGGVRGGRSSEGPRAAPSGDGGGGRSAGGSGAARSGDGGGGRGGRGR